MADEGMELPRLHDELIEPPDVSGVLDMHQTKHAQCTECGKIVHGPGKDPDGPLLHKRPVAFHIDETGKTYNREEAEAAGLPHNQSGTFCRDCLPGVMQKYRTSNAKSVFARWKREMDTYRAREHEKQAYANKRPVPEAYTPVPEAHEPVAEAHTPVPEAHEPVAQPEAESKED